MMFEKSLETNPPSECKQLLEIVLSDMIELMNHPLIWCQMPRIKEHLDAKNVAAAIPGLCHRW